jgi:hypothetical protein
MAGWFAGGFSRWRGIFRGLLLAVEYKFLAKLERPHEATMRIVLLDSFTVKLGSAIPLALNQPDYKMPARRLPPWTARLR